MRNGKTALWRTIKILALLLPAVAFVLWLPVSDSDDTWRVRDFYREEPNSLDVVVLGASEVYTGFSPADAYAEFGLTSYPYVISGNWAGFLPRQIGDVLSRQSPQVVVIEITEALNGASRPEEARLRQYLEGLPLSARHNLIQAYGKKDPAWSYYLPFSLYHGNARPSGLAANARRTAAVHRRGYSLLKGTMTYTGTGCDWSREDWIDTRGDTSQCEIRPQTLADFEALLDCCDRNPDTNFLFVSFPHRIVDTDGYYRFQLANAVGARIRERGYEYVNLDCLQADLGVGPEDFYDNEHMNYAGQQKTTRYLCRLLTERGLTPRPQTPENRARWERCRDYGRRYGELYRQELGAGSCRWLKEDAALLKELRP